MELIEAIDNNDIDLVIRLLNRGVDVNYQEDIVGESPLMTASKEGNKNIVDILLNAGADVNLLDSNDDNALTYATSYANVHYNLRENELMRDRIHRFKLVAKKLLDNGINPFHRNDEGDTTYDVAITYRVIEIAELIKHYMRIYRIQALRRGNLTRRKLRTSMARRRSALSRFGDRYGLGEDVIQMLSHMSIPGRFDMTRPSHVDMIDETPYNMRGSGKNPCWENYKMVGMKNKNGKRVPNCVYKNL